MEYADLLVHVIDASDPEREAHIEVVNRLIAQLAGENVPVIECYNKCDAPHEEITKGENRVCMSARTGAGEGELLKTIERLLAKRLHRVKLLLPYAVGGMVDTLHTQAKVLSIGYAADGIAVEAVLDETLYGKLRQYIIER